MDRSDVTLERMRTFVRVAERGSLSVVAREISSGQSTVSRHIQELEAALGAPLFTRTTRHVALTEEGRSYHARCLHILRLVDEAADDVRAARGAFAGTVRISCTAALGVLHVAKLVFGFQDRHPDIKVEFGLTDERIDLVREGVDLALRLGPLPDSTLRLKRLGESRRLLVASPAYLAARGRPRHPNDLATHEGIRMANVAGSDVVLLREHGAPWRAVPFAGRLSVDHGLAAREALLAGRGIAPAHRWLVHDLLSEDRLDVVLPGYELTSVPLNLLIVPERAQVARIRLFVDHLAREVRRIPGLVAGEGPGPEADRA